MIINGNNYFSTKNLSMKYKLWQQFSEVRKFMAMLAAQQLRRSF
jgi:hypothetical protein